MDDNVEADDDALEVGQEVEGATSFEALQNATGDQAEADMRTQEEASQLEASTSIVALHSDDSVNVGADSRAQVRISWGVHGLLKVSLGPAIPYHSMPHGRPPLKWPYCRFRGGRPKEKQPLAVLLPPWIPHAIRA
jgi:hypothetical protein